VLQVQRLDQTFRVGGQIGQAIARRGRVGVPPATMIRCYGPVWCRQSFDDMIPDPRRPMRRLKYDGSFSVEDGTGEPGVLGSNAAGLSREPIVLCSGTTASAKASLRGVGVLEDVLSRFVDPYQTTDMCAARRLYEELR